MSKCQDENSSSKDAEIDVGWTRERTVFLTDWSKKALVIRSYLNRGEA